MAGITDMKMPRLDCTDNPDGIDLEIIRAIQKGLPMVPRPYHDIGAGIGIDENEVIARLGRLIDTGIIKRFGVVLHHHELGYQSNAMVVWDIPDQQVDMFAEKMILFPFVTLCYRRPRRLPSWRYNLYSMIHGQDRDSVMEKIDEINILLNTGGFDYMVLFSKRRFKQQGAFYMDDVTRESITTSKALTM